MYLSDGTDSDENSDASFENAEDDLNHFEKTIMTPGEDSAKLIDMELVNLLKFC